MAPWPLVALLSLHASAANVSGRASVRTGQPGVQAGGLTGTAIAPVQLSVTPLSLLPQTGSALNASPAPLPVLASILPAPALLSPAPAAMRPAQSALPAAEPAAHEGPAKLIDTLSAPLAEPAPHASAESTAGAEKDFMARAQLGGAIESSPALSLPAASGQVLPSGLSPANLTPKAKGSAQVLPFNGIDHSGDVMKAALAELAALPPGRDLRLKFAPSPKSLRVLAELDHEVLLTRGRADGVWRLSRGDRHGVSGEHTDYDYAIHNHPEARWGAYSLQTDYPSPQDLETSRGKNARFMVVSKSGVTEWNSDLPEGLSAKLEQSTLDRFVMRITFPSLYPWQLSRKGVAVEQTSWKKFDQAALDSGRAPINERILIETLIPRWVAEELPEVAARLGRPLDDAHRADVLARTHGYRMYWHSAYTYKDHPDGAGIPDGHFSTKFGIRLMVTPDWRKLKDPKNHFKVLFAHEYTHWLQSEGLITGRGDAEAEAVAVELLRAIELVGLEGIAEGRIGIISPNNMAHFESGRAAVMKDWYEAGLYVRGALGGAAYEVGKNGNGMEDAWRFFRFVAQRELAGTLDGVTVVTRSRDRVLAK